MQHHLLADLRSGVRMLVKFPTLSLGAIVTLGVGIGLSTTVFSIVNGAMWKGLSFPAADRIMAIDMNNVAQRQRQMAVGILDLGVMIQRQTSFEKIGAYQFRALNVSAEAGRPERLRAAALSAAAFESLGVQPLLGRGFRPAEEQGGHDGVILLGEQLWRERFGASASVIGQTIRVDGNPRTIIGVMPERFAFPIREAVWIPLVILNPLAPRGQDAKVQVVGRLKPGVSVRQANAQIAGIAQQLAREFPQTNDGTTAEVVPYAKTALDSELYALLYTMLGAGIGVLLIACVNVSNLLLARASLRRREVAVRMALGAAANRVILQHLTEVLVLATAGGALGVLLSLFGIRWFTTAMTDPPPFWMTFDLDWRAMSFVTGLIVLASLAGGGLPALHSARVSAGAVLKDDSRSSTSASLGRFSSALVVAELAISCGLLVAAGLMTKSVTQLKYLPMPFAVDDILTARVDLPRERYPDSAASIRFFELLLPRLRALPGVEGATLSDGLPAAGNGSIPVHIEGHAYARESDAPVVREGIVTDGYFSTFRTKLLSGREFTPADTAASQPVAIVNASFARAHFPNKEAIGHQFKRIRAGRTEPWLTIVGVVPDLLMEGIGNNNASPIGYYIPIPQSDVANSVRIAVRVKGDPAGAAPFVRSAVAALDSDLAIYELETLRRVIDRRTWFYTVFGTFFMTFGACALLLAAAGLYGVMSFAVTQRTREMGVRSALGAPAHRLITLVMRRSFVQLAIGLFLGLVLAILGSGGLQPVLYRVNPRDPGIFALVGLTLALTALAATLFPAARVARIDPAIALTVE